MPPLPITLALGKVQMLVKSLYSLVQAPRVQYNTLTAQLLQIEFRVSLFNLCIYIYTTKALIISVHINNICMYAASYTLIYDFREELSKLFTITSEDSNALYLSMHIKHTQSTIKIY